MSVNNYCKNLPAKCKLEHQLKNFTNNYKVNVYQGIHLRVFSLSEELSRL